MLNWRFLETQHNQDHFRICQHWRFVWLTSDRIICNHWMRLSRIWRVLQISTQAEYFIIHSKYFPFLKGVSPFCSLYFCSPKITQPRPQRAFFHSIKTRMKCFLFLLGSAKQEKRRPFALTKSPNCAGIAFHCFFFVFYNSCRISGLVWSTK